MEETAKVEEGHLSSAAAFVEGGIQDACDDACSICLEAFTESDPSTVTSCKHEFHLQCILDWCQRSSQCPMCWQELSFKDSTSQEIFEGVKQERNIRLNQTHSTNIFHHPALGDFELQHLQVGGGDVQLNEHILQQIAAAAAMGRTHHIARRDGHRGRSGSHGRPQFLVFTTHANAPSAGSESGNGFVPSIITASASNSLNVSSEESASHSPHIVPIEAHSNAGLTSRTSMTPSRVSNGRNSAEQTTPVIQDRPGPSDFQSFSESLKSRLNAVSMRYKESITKSTRGWRERLFSRNSTVADLVSEDRREVDDSIASVSRMMEHLETRETRRNSGSSATLATEVHLGEPRDEGANQNNATTHPNDTPPASSFIATSGSQ